jgi:hypothetical protein
MKTRLLGLLLCGGWLLAGAEVLRVPEDYDRVQRAVTAAAPGDTVRVGAGVFFGSISITKPITLRGEGKDASRLVGLSRDWPVLILGSTDDVVVLEGFTAVHPAVAEGSAAEQADAGGSIISMWAGGAKIRDLRLENASGAGVQVGWRAQADLSRMEFVGPSNVPVAVDGESARVEWPDATPEQRAAIAWREGAMPDAPPPPPVSEEELMYDRSLFEIRQVEAHLRRVEPLRRGAARALQAQLRAHAAAEMQARALETFLHAMLDTYHVQLPADEQANILINDEVRAFITQHGVKALATAAAQWRANETLGEPWEDFFALRLDPALWEQWTSLDEMKIATDHEALIAAAFARLENPPSDDAEQAAQGFHTSLRELLALVTEAEKAGRAGDLRQTLVTRIKEATPGFATKAGYPALARVLKLVASEPDSLVKAPELQALLTPEQRRELLRAMRSP